MVTDAVRIRVIRALLNLTQSELAARIGVSCLSVCHWELGRAVPLRKNRKALAEVCRVENISFLPGGMPIPKEESVVESQAEVTLA